MIKIQKNVKKFKKIAKKVKKIEKSLKKVLTNVFLWGIIYLTNKITR